jgi:protein-disulfide isomerase
MRKSIRCIGYLFVLGLSGSLLIAADSDTCPELATILTELRELRKLIESKPVTPIQTRLARIDVGEAPSLGLAGAPITIIEFSDYQCTFCQKFYKETFPDLKRTYIDSGKVRFYIMHYPLDRHANATIAAEAAQCANDQRQFWPMHNLLVHNPQALEATNLLEYAGKIQIDVRVFKQCLESEKYLLLVHNNEELARAQ